MRLIGNSLAMGLCILGIGLGGNIASAAPRDTGSKNVVIPTVYESGHFYAVPQLANGQRMRFLLDTGGGTTPAPFISETQASRLDLKPDHTCQLGSREVPAVSPVFAAGQALPDLSATCKGVMILPDMKDYKEPFGQFVPMYFIGGRWTFDYPGRKVIVRGAAWQPSPRAHEVALGFKPVDESPLTGWPRVQIRVDGDVMDMLLDTGATAQPTAASLAANPTDVTDGQTVGSYITHSVFERWREKHPDWKVLENGDALFSTFPRTIRVPHVEIAGWNIGPVWFIERPDKAFHGMMAELMDKPPEGAVGANMLAHFRMTIDYPKRTASFECVDGCTTAATSGGGLSAASSH